MYHVKKYLEFFFSSSIFWLLLTKYFYSVGHPFVSLGLGFKSYIQYKMRIKTQKHVEKENNFYYELLKGALPQPEPQQLAIQSTG